ncbi:glycosyltransferase [Nostocales cyanobacterium LEGE 11386]|nr:glycosyltransferase [Nostocales cyanobacterium LEGE 11386]
MTKVAWLQPIWSKYHIARAKAFHQDNHNCQLICLSISDVCGEVNSSDWVVKNFDELNHQVLFSGRKYLDISPWKITVAVINFVLRHNVDVLCLLGYARPEVQQIALSLSFFTNKPALILLSESKKDDISRAFWRESFKSQFLKLYQSALVGGQVHKHYLIELGMTANSIFLGYDIVGNEVFNPNKIRQLSTPLKKPYFLAINRFVSKKNLLFLLLAYAAYRQIAGANAWDLILCGDGELRPRIEEEITTQGIKDYVHLPGFLQQDELLPYFAHATCFIHASIQEQWGLVVNEAMAAGLPVLVSNRCGCFEDLVLEGINGFGFDPENQQELTQLMVKISSKEVDLQAMGQASWKHIQNFSPDYFAQGLMQAVEYALAHR